MTAFVHYEASGCTNRTFLPHHVQIRLLLFQEPFGIDPQAHQVIVSVGRGTAGGTLTGADRKLIRILDELCLFDLDVMFLQGAGRFKLRFPRVKG